MSSSSISHITIQKKEKVVNSDVITKTNIKTESKASKADTDIAETKAEWETQWITSQPLLRKKLVEGIKHLNKKDKYNIFLEEVIIVTCIVF